MIKNKLFLVFYLLITLILFSACNGDQEGTPEQPLTFENGYFVLINGQGSESGVSKVTFYDASNPRNSFDYNHRDIYNLVNDEEIEGVLVDLTIHEDKAYMLTRTQNWSKTNVTILDKRTFQKLDQFTLNIPSSDEIIVDNNRAYISDFVEGIYVVDLSTKSIIKKLRLENYGNVKNMRILNGKLYHAVESGYGKVVEIDLASLTFSKIFNIGPYPTSLHLNNKGTFYMTVQRIFNENSSDYNRDEFLLKDVTYGILELDPVNNTLKQLIETDFAYPKFLVEDNNMYCFMEFDSKVFSFEYAFRFWNPQTNHLSEAKTYLNFGTSYALTTSLKFKDSFLFHTQRNSVTILHKDDNSYARAALSDETTFKLVYNQ
jgi:hypothetical protein